MASIATALDDLLNNRELSIGQAVGRHFTEDYRQRTDGVWSDRPGFIEHMEYLRAAVESAEIRVLDEFEQDGSYADRHEAHIVKTDGATVVQEVYLFATLADDGRFAEVHELTHMLTGAEEDRDIGRARA